MKTSMLARLVLLITGLLAAYQVSAGIDGLATLPIIAYTLGFGVLLVAALLLIILGFEVLDSSLVVIAASLIPLSLSLGLVWQHLPIVRLPYLVFAVLAWLAIVLTRSLPAASGSRLLVLVLAHGLSGMVIFLLPFMLSIQGKVQPAFSLVSLGGALIGLGGLLLVFLKSGRPILSRQKILQILPVLLLLMTLCFVQGFRYG